MSEYVIKRDDGLYLDATRGFWSSSLNEATKYHSMSDVLKGWKKIGTLQMSYELSVWELMPQTLPEERRVLEETEGLPKGAELKFALRHVTSKKYYMLNISGGNLFTATLEKTPLYPHPEIWQSEGRVVRVALFPAKLSITEREVK